MATSLLNLATEVNYAVGNDPNLLTTAKNWVARAYQVIQDSTDLPEAFAVTTFNTVIGTQTYATPADFFSIYSLRNVTRNWKIEQRSIQTLDKLTTTAQNSPYLYAIRLPQTLVLYPIPSAIEQLQLSYRKTLPALVNDGDMHVLPVSWENAIIFAAMAFGFDYKNEVERGAAARKSLQMELSRLTDRRAANLLDRDEPIAPTGLARGAGV